MNLARTPPVERVFFFFFFGVVPFLIPISRADRLRATSFPCCLRKALLGFAALTLPSNFQHTHAVLGLTVSLSPTEAVLFRLWFGAGLLSARGRSQGRSPFSLSLGLFFFCSLRCLFVFVQLLVG